MFFSGPPGAPSKPKADDIFKESCKLSWRPPQEDGGSPVIGYHVERTTADVIRWFRINKDIVKDTTYTATNFMEGNEYLFRVVAENAIGCGPPGDKSDKILAKDPWGNALKLVRDHACTVHQYTILCHVHVHYVHVHVEVVVPDNIVYHFRQAWQAGNTRNR